MLQAVKRITVAIATEDRRSPTGKDPYGRRWRSTTVKEKIHPKYHQAEVHCASCKSTFTVGSTRTELRVDVCSNCHPFYTGKQTIIDTAGQVERFQKRLERSARA
jgi:large subunit ribosomal protein L31